MTATPPRLRVLPDRELSAVMRRSLLLQAGWNFEGMQNLGFLYAIEPGLERIHHDPERRRRAMMRHLGFFNTQPYMAGFAVGACMALEEDAASCADAAGEAAAVERVERVKRALGSALAALGDPFYWGTLRPATAAFTLLAWVALWTLEAPAPFFWGAVIGLVLYNVPALWTRWRGPRMGYELGEGLPAALKRLRWQDKSRAVRAAGFAGALLLAAAVLAVPPFGGAPSPWLAAVLAAGFALRLKGVPSLRTYLAAALGLALASAVGL